MYTLIHPLIHWFIHLLFSILIFTLTYLSTHPLFTYLHTSIYHFIHKVSNFFFFFMHSPTNSLIQVFGHSLFISFFIQKSTVWGVKLINKLLIHQFFVHPTHTATHGRQKSSRIELVSFRLLVFLPLTGWPNNTSSCRSRLSVLVSLMRQSIYMRPSFVGYIYQPLYTKSTLLF